MENIHNWSLLHSSQDYDLASHTTDVVCVNFMYEFKVDFEGQIFVEKLFMAILFILRVIITTCR